MASEADLMFLISGRETGRVSGELAFTNFDTQRLEEITSKGIHISSNQVQYSLIDQSPAARMQQFCLDSHIELLTYGTLAGGFLSERCLGKAAPTSREDLNTVSLSKYENMINTLFQDLLVALETIARRHGCSVASMATHYVLDCPAVGGVIVGCRLGVAWRHINDILRSCSHGLELTEEDLNDIEAETRRSRNLVELKGD
ncbi:uncharacterized protein LOC129349504 [Amphiprion ocellaris]|uniref:uncharacterized protein LOC129349504 n=1 Tax=Amphiprion ocellaris TaxID=80972 RepID=UPI00241124DD|nr:uncharacterized protein LOC129349504 [Amphiprion ocellaris]